jgi:hypothetical protein
MKEEKTSEPRDLRYRAFVGPSDKYDILAAAQFNMLINLGLRDDHYLLDIGCGSLCGGRLFIPYLLPGRYYGVEPVEWLVEEGLKNELGYGILDVKIPIFNNNDNFEFTVFGKKFDYLLAHSIFTHASPSQINKCLSATREVMKESSLFVATFVVGYGDDYGDSWLYNEFSVYSWETIEKLYKSNGLICTRLDSPHPIGQTWVLGKPNDEIPLPCE